MNPITFAVHRFQEIKCLSSSLSSFVNYELVDSSIPLNINQMTGEISSKTKCPNLNQVLIKCYDVLNRKKHAYAKIIFDPICRKNPIKQSNTNWINRISEERRQRIHYREPKISVKNFKWCFIILS